MAEKSIKEQSKEWCAEHSNKGCKEPCKGCWQLNTGFGCEQHKMEESYIAGSEAMLDKACKYIETILFLHTAIKVEDIVDYVEKFRKLCRE